MSAQLHRLSTGLHHGAKRLRDAHHAHPGNDDDSYIGYFALGSAVASASPVTYDFTGYTTTVTGSFDSLEGATVSGSFIIDFDAAIASQSSGTPGSSASWESKASGGVNQSLPLPPALVFSESVTLNGQTHTSAPMSPFFSASSVSGETSDGELNAGVAFESPTVTKRSKPSHARLTRVRAHQVTPQVHRRCQNDRFTMFPFGFDSGRTHSTTVEPWKVAERQ